jgi:hypothetical protein
MCIVSTIGFCERNISPVGNWGNESMQNIEIVGVETSLWNVGSKAVNISAQINPKIRVQWTRGTLWGLWSLYCENSDWRGYRASPFAEQYLKMAMPTLRQLNSGSDELVQSFTVGTCRRSVQGSVGQLKRKEIMWRGDILFLKDAATYWVSSQGLEINWIFHFWILCIACGVTFELQDVPF